jgi:membrane protein YqaA with SNARE-associated domain
MAWKESIIEWFDIFGPAALAMLSFTEAIIQPVPPDLLYLPMLLDAGSNAPLVFWLWMVVTVASVSGALIGYYVGQRFGVQLIEYFGYERHLHTLQSLTEKYGGIGIFIAAFSPLPYKVFGWVAGMASMDKKAFVIAGVLGRGLRFGAEAILIWFYGDSLLDAIMWFLDNELLLGIVLVIVCGLAGYFVLKAKPKPSTQSAE